MTSNLPIHADIAGFVDDLRRITGTETEADRIIDEVRPLVKRLVETPTWMDEAYRECDEEQGFGVHVLHEEADHSLTILVASWLPGRGIPPHDHGTWSVVGGVEGVERNILWKLVESDADTGYAKLKRTGHVDLKPGDLISNLERDIHSIENPSDGITLTFHVYGMHINHTRRFGYDPAQESFAPLKVSIE